MAADLTAQLDAIPRKTLAMRGESLRKPLADDAMKRALGAAISRAIDAAHLTKQIVAAEMGYGENQSPLSRWIAGTETPQFAKLFEIDALKLPLVAALADLAGAETVTTITIRRRA